MRQQQKIIIIGLKGFEGNYGSSSLKCVEWTQITTFLNLSDYDVVIFYVPTLQTADSERVDWNALDSTITFGAAQNILRHNGKIISIGDVRFEKKYEHHNKHEALLNFTWRFASWTGINLDWDHNPGDTIEFKERDENKSYKNYLDQLKRWRYSLRHYEIDKNILNKDLDIHRLRQAGLWLNSSEEIVATNRYGNLLVFSIRYGLNNVFNHSGQEHWELVRKLGPMIFLPKTEASAEEEILTVLRDLCDLEIVAPEPEWIKNRSAPGQNTIDRKIETLEEQIEKSRGYLNEALAKRSETRRCLKLLYEKEYELEPVVRNILGELGAEVEEPSESNKEDGWIKVKVGKTTFEGVLEIKSTQKESFNEKGIKQLLDWVNRGITQRKKKYKGLFIGNSSADQPVETRPLPFPDSWRESAEIGEICALATVDLYRVYEASIKGTINLDDFWTAVFKTNGILDLSEIFQQD